LYLSMIPNLAASLRLLLVTDDSLVEGRDLVAICRAAEQGGVTAVQVRLKQAEPRSLVELVRELKSAISIPVMVNDRLDVALAAGAVGVHLGPDDLPVPLARAIVPPDFVIGTSVGSQDETVNGAQADYWGIGPYRTTTTKTDAGIALGVEGLRRLVRMAAGKTCVAIGGVTPEDVPAILEAGANGVAVVSGILRHADIESASRRYAQAPGERRDRREHRNRDTNEGQG
ncbi:MAG: thiamine phosphate synthase, partial [Gemmatimonadota bacterium]